MGIFSRLADIVNSNINAILDRAEDPEKIIRLIIQEMEDTLVEVRSSAVRTIAEKKEIERRLAALGASRRNGSAAPSSPSPRTARISPRARCSPRRASPRRWRRGSSSSPQIEDALAKQNEDIGKLQAKLADAKTREKAIVARQKTAAARIKLRTQLYDERITDAFARFEQVERALDEMEGKVEVFDLGRKKTLADELAGIEADARRRGGAEGAEGAARQPHSAEAAREVTGCHAIGVAVFVLGIIFLIVVAPIWILFHYSRTGARRAGCRATTRRRWASSGRARGAWRGASRRSKKCSTRSAGLAHARRRLSMAWTNNGTRFRLWRDTDRGILAGVCAGIADYIGVEPIVVRLAAVLGLVFFFVADDRRLCHPGDRLLKPKPPALYASRDEEAFWRGVGTAPADTLHSLRRKFTRPRGAAAARMESQVTSGDFDLHRKFRDLGR